MIVVIGDHGRIGPKLVSRLRPRCRDDVAILSETWIEACSGAELGEALAGARIVADLGSACEIEGRETFDTFETSRRALLAAEATAGVGHHVALSVVGTERLLSSDRFRAKLAQEDLIKAAGIPYTILRATQFFEFIQCIAEAGYDGDVIRLSPALVQPVAGDDVADVLADVVLAPPLTATIEVAGPEARPLDEFACEFLAARGDRRRVIADVRARYFGTSLNDRSLTPGDRPRLGATRFADWLSRSTHAHPLLTSHPQ